VNIQFDTIYIFEYIALHRYIQTDIAYAPKIQESIEKLHGRFKQPSDASLPFNQNASASAMKRGF
jgi:hypothetical protein